NKLLEILIQNSGQIFQNCIEESFDYLTMYYPDNRVHIEGWKTNERWRAIRFIVKSYNTIAI
ncbi:MAG: hypothetical protein ACRC92_22285, partial [Peptostreptococcaceae bacterium]